MSNPAIKLILAGFIFSWLAGLAILLSVLVGERDAENFFPRLAVGLYGLAVIATGIGISLFLFVGWLD